MLNKNFKNSYIIVRNAKFTGEDIPQQIRNHFKKIMIKVSKDIATTPHINDLFNKHITCTAMTDEPIINGAVPLRFEFLEKELIETIDYHDKNYGRCITHAGCFNIMQDIKLRLLRGLMLGKKVKVDDTKIRLNIFVIDNFYHFTNNQNMFNKNKLFKITACPIVKRCYCFSIKSLNNGNYLSIDIPFFNKLNYKINSIFNYFGFYMLKMADFYSTSNENLME